MSVGIVFLPLCRPKKAGGIAGAHGVGQGMG
jgi:hypothetical protein